MDLISAHRNQKWNRFTNYTACAFPSCGAAAGPPIQVPPASPVFILWSPLASLPNSDGSAPQLAIAIRIN